MRMRYGEFPYSHSLWKTYTYTITRTVSVIDLGGGVGDAISEIPMSLPLFSTDCWGSFLS